MQVVETHKYTRIQTDLGGKKTCIGSNIINLLAPSKGSAHPKHTLLKKDDSAVYGHIMLN